MAKINLTEWRRLSGIEPLVEQSVLRSGAQVEIVRDRRLYQQLLDWEDDFFSDSLLSRRIYATLKKKGYLDPRRDTGEVYDMIAAVHAELGLGTAF